MKILLLLSWIVYCYKAEDDSDVDFGPYHALMVDAPPHEVNQEASFEKRIEDIENIQVRDTLDPETEEEKALPDEIYIIGDVHGDYQMFKDILIAAHIIFEDTLEWVHTDKKRTVIQLGDMLDRGPQSIEAVQLLRKLQMTAQDGDRVVRLIGNHEQMMVCGQYNYFNQEELNRSFGGSQENLRAAYSPHGDLGMDLRANHVVVYKLGDVLFTHAGLEPNWAHMEPEKLLELYWTDIDGNKCVGKHQTVNAPEHSILWTRTLSNQSKTLGSCDYIERVIDMAGVSTVVVGHTPTTSGAVEQYCDRRWIMHDTAISRWMRGTASYSVMYRTYHDDDYLAPVSRWNHIEYYMQKDPDKNEKVFARRLLNSRYSSTANREYKPDDEL